MASGAGGGGNVSIGGTAALITTGRTTRDKILVQNVHATQDLYVGFTEGVTTANGLKVKAGESVEICASAPLWGIASGAGTDVRFLETY